MDKNKLMLPVTLLLASIILGGFYYASQVSKQESIERQQERKDEQDTREYIAERKMECYEIYEKERDQYNNVKNFGYVENYNIDGTPDFRDDTCEIIYKNNETGKYFRKYY